MHHPLMLLSLYTSLVLAQECTSTTQCLSTAQVCQQGACTSLQAAAATFFTPTNIAITVGVVIAVILLAVWLCRCCRCCCFKNRGRRPKLPAQNQQPGYAMHPINDKRLSRQSPATLPRGYVRPPHSTNVNVVEFQAAPPIQEYIVYSNKDDSEARGGEKYHTHGQQHQHHSQDAYYSQQPQQYYQDQYYPEQIGGGVYYPNEHGGDEMYPNDSQYQGDFAANDRYFDENQYTPNQHNVSAMQSPLDSSRDYRDSYVPPVIPAYANGDVYNHKPSSETPDILARNIYNEPAEMTGEELDEQELKNEEYRQFQLDLHGTYGQATDNNVEQITQADVADVTLNDPAPALALVPTEKAGPILSSSTRPPREPGLFAFWDRRGQFHQGYMDDQLNIHAGIFDDHGNFHFGTIGDHEPIFVEDAMMAGRKMHRRESGASRDLQSESSTLPKSLLRRQNTPLAQASENRSMQVCQSIE